MKEITLNKALLGIFAILVIITLLTLKIGGSSNLPNLVERDGYCKNTLGENWDYDEVKQLCYTFVNSIRQEQTFTEEQFREVCPKNKFLSIDFYSECFHKGDSRNNP